MEEADHHWCWEILLLKSKFQSIIQNVTKDIIPYHFLNFLKCAVNFSMMCKNISFSEGCPIHPHCNDPLKAYSVRSIRTDR